MPKDATFFRPFMLRCYSFPFSHSRPYIFRRKKTFFLSSLLRSVKLFPRRSSFSNFHYVIFLFRRPTPSDTTISAPAWEQTEEEKFSSSPTAVVIVDFCVCLCQTCVVLCHNGREQVFFSVRLSHVRLFLLATFHFSPTSLDVVRKVSIILPFYALHSFSLPSWNLFRLLFFRQRVEFIGIIKISCLCELVSWVMQISSLGWALTGCGCGKSLNEANGWIIILKPTPKKLLWASGWTLWWCKNQHRGFLLSFDWRRNLSDVLFTKHSAKEPSLI